MTVPLGHASPVRVFGVDFLAADGIAVWELSNRVAQCCGVIKFVASCFPTDRFANVFAVGTFKSLNVQKFRWEGNL